MPVTLLRDPGRIRNQRPGALVLLRAALLPDPIPGLPAEAEVVCLNALRMGKDFRNHYLVPLDPLPGPREALSLIYVDFDIPVKDVSEHFALELIRERTPEATAGAAIGAVIENSAGHFLKVQEPYKGAFSLAYVDLMSGHVKRRQESTVNAVHRWALQLTGKDPRSGWLARIRRGLGGA